MQFSRLRWPAVHPEPPGYDRGVIANGTYTNDCLGFSLILPEGWEANNRGGKRQGWQSTPEAASDC